MVSANVLQNPSKSGCLAGHRQRNLVRRTWQRWRSERQLQHRAIRSPTIWRWRMSRTRFIVSASVLLVTSLLANAWGQEKPTEANSILNKMRQTYHGLRSYHFAHVLRIDEHKAGDQAV